MHAELALPRGRRTIATHTALRTRNLPVVPYVLVLLLLPTAVVVGAMTAGWWATTGTTASAQAAVGQADRSTNSSANGAGPAAPVAAADIKGSMTVQQVIDAFPVTAAQVFAEFGAVPDLPTSTQLKTLVEGGTGLDIPALRTWLAASEPG